MTDQLLRLSIEDVWGAAEHVDTVALLIDELVTGGMPTLPTGPAGEFTVVEDREAGMRSLLPVAALRAVRTAGLTAVAARRLLPAGAVTAAAVVARGPVAELQVSALARDLPDLSHIAIARPAPGDPLAPRLRRQLEGAGVGVFVTHVVADAVQGANLVLVSHRDESEQPLSRSGLSPGTLVVCAQPGPPPLELVAGASELYVDYLGLLRAAAPEYPLAPPGGGGGDTSMVGSRLSNSAPRRAVAADLVHVLTGTHPGRTNMDDVIMVVLLSAAGLSAELARRLHRAARAHGLGLIQPE